VCPRCRRADDDGALVRFPLEAELEGRRIRAVPGELHGTHAVACTNPDCLAQYPVVEGIPVVFRDPNAIDLLSCMPYDVTAIPNLRLIAAVTGQSPDAGLSALVARLSRLTWAGFHDWLGDDWQVPGVSCEVHAVQVLRWIRALGISDPGADGVSVVLGSGLGREAWEVERGAVLLVDAHLPSLLASQRLRRTGALEVLMRQDAQHWRPLTLEAKRAPAVPVAAVCCDAQDPPFDGGWAHSVILPNVVDSVSNPYLLLMQARALVREGGKLTVSSPFTWRPEVTQRSQWLESASPCAGTSAEEVVVHLMTREPPGEISLVGRTQLSWCTRSSSREAVVYQNAVMSFSSPGARRRP
jgi:hypothetical protein